MTQEEKELLLKDLCARLPYRPIVRVLNRDGVIRNIPLSSGNIAYVEKLEKDWWTECKPFLRPMSDMTKEEKVYLSQRHFYEGESAYANVYIAAEVVDWMTKHHLDFRGLIPKGLALQAPEGMYELK